jgi:homoserine kinase
LGSWARGGDDPVYRSLEVAPLRVVVAVPLIDEYDPHREPLPDPSLDDVVHAVAHSALLVEALQTEDLDLLREALDDRLHVPYRRALIPGYDRVENAACRLGAIGVTLCGAGPALLIFADYGHAEIARAVQVAFRQAGVPARTWTLNVDMQGVVISVVQ